MTVDKLQPWNRDRMMHLGLWLLVLLVWLAVFAIAVVSVCFVVSAVLAVAVGFFSPD